MSTHHLPSEAETPSTSSVTRWATRMPGNRNRWVLDVGTEEPALICPLHDADLFDGYCEACVL